MHDDIVLSSLVEKTEPGSTPGIMVTSFKMSGETYMAAIVDAVAAAYVEEHPFDEGRLAELDGKPVTLLRTGRSEFGVTAIRVQQGKLFKEGRAVLPKGKRKNGFRLDPDTVLDLIEGYNHDGELRERVAQIRERFPETKELTKDRLRELPPIEARSDVCTLAVFGSWHGPEGSVPGAVWLIHSYDPEDDIVEGVLLVGGYAESEHGSIYGDQLLRMGGEIVGFTQISLADALDLTHVDVDEAIPIVKGLAA